MTDNSLDSLLDWMKDKRNIVMWGWDAIAAMTRSKTNMLLIQQYIARFTEDSYLPPISGVVPISDGKVQERLRDFILDAPRLSFERLDPDDPHSSAKGLLTCAILGGVQVTMVRDVDQWNASKLVETDPLQGPRLTLDLILDQVPGNVEVNGDVKFDLRYSDNFKLTFGQTLIEQELGGKFFRDLFQNLPPEQRVWTLGRIAKGNVDGLTPRSFKLGMQANRLASLNVSDASYGDGALLICMSMGGGQPAATPPQEHRYLIPDDAGEDYSATVLFDRDSINNALAVKHVLDRVAELIGNRDFTVTHDEHGRFLSAVATGGGLHTPESVTPMGPIAYGDQSVTIFVTRTEMFFSASGPEPLRIYVEDNVICVDWSSEALEHVVTSSSVSEDILSDQLYRIEVKSRYQLGEEGDELVLTPTLDVKITSSKIENPTGSGDGTAFYGLVLLYLAANLILLVRGLIGPKIDHALKVALKVSVPVSSFIKESIRLNFGNAIQGEKFRAPRDIGFFGRVDPKLTTFTINPLEPLMAAGGSQVFTLEGFSAAVNWHVYALEEDTPGLGSVDSNGVYTAPLASQISGRFLRERVVAENKTLPAVINSSALVTVLVNQLTINPLIQLCDYDRTVELAAGALSGGELQWTVRNSSGDNPGSVAPSALRDGDHTYTPPAKVGNKTYVLDEVVISNAQGTRSAWVLVKQMPSSLVVKPASAAVLTAGKLQLQAIFGSRDVTEICTWSLPMNGPGSIDESTGLYTSDPESTERFVLVFGLVDGGLLGEIEGHIILPLPLGEFGTEVEMMKA